MAQQEGTIRRIAAHKVVVDGETLRQHVVVISEGRVVDCFPLTEELPMTEWLSGTIDVLDDAEGTGKIALYHGRCLS